MNPKLKMALLATVGVAMAAQTASASNTYSANNDVLLEFKAAGAANDVIFDLGSQTQFYSGGQTIDLSTIGYNSANLSSLGASSGLNWEVISAFSAGTTKGVIVTDETGFNVSAFSGNTAAGLAAAQINNSGNAYAGVAGAGVLNPHAVLIGTSVNGSYTQYGDQIHGQLNGISTVVNSDFSAGSGDVIASAVLEELDKGNNPQVLGTITMDETTGQMLFTAVPEPATYGLLAGAGLLALSLGRQLGRRKLA